MTNKPFGDRRAGLRPLTLVVLCPLLVGCGAVAGTLLDTSLDIATHPFKEYLAWGAFKYDNTWDEPYQPLAVERDMGEVLVGVCVSGGGSRSAYFMACVAEELSRIPVQAGSGRTYLDEVDFISSVSGGSLAAAYYCLRRFDGEEKSDAEFFERYKADMRKDFELRSLGRLALGYWILDFFTHYDRADLIASVWDGNFFDGDTFAELAEAERRGGPTLILNGTCLSNGLKFVYSTLPDSSFHSKLFDRIKDESFVQYGVAEGLQPFQTIGFQTINSDISQYRVAKAVAASASVPNLLGPVSLLVRPDSDGVEHLFLPEGGLLSVSDGGVCDNWGLESLMQVVTDYLDDHPGQPARILVVDGAGYFDVDPGLNAGDFSVAYYADRTLSISWMRGKAYMEYVFQQTRQYRDENGEQPYRNLAFDLVSLYDRLPSQERPAFPLTVHDGALRKLLRPDVATRDFLKRVTTIQTRFKVKSADAEVIEEAAKRSTTLLRHRFGWTDER